MSTSIPPRASGGGNAKFAIIGVLLLLGGGLAVYFATRKGPAPPDRQPEQPVAVADASAPRVGPTVGAQIVIPDPEPDAGAEDAEAVASVDAGRRIRYVTRVVQECPGTVDLARVQATVRANYGGVRECYNRLLRTNPSLRGRATARMIINTNGTVGDVGTGGAVTRDRQFKTCFEGALSRMRFTAPQRGCAIVELPFNFTPDS